MMIERSSLIRELSQNMPKCLVVPRFPRAFSFPDVFSLLCRTPQSGFRGVSSVTDHFHATPQFARELAKALELARAAGSAILNFYGKQNATEYEKGDGSPVTDADYAADRLIREGLAAAFPSDATLTEESADDGSRLGNPRCWVVDPLDGTAQFIGHTGEFDVMIALVEDELPVVGVIFQPTTGLMYYASRGGGAWREKDGEAHPVAMRIGANPPVVAASKYYGGRELPNTLHRIATAVEAADPAVWEVGYQPRRIVGDTRIADSFVGLWPPSGQRFAREWDLAAPDIFTTEAGGVFTDAMGQPYRYNQQDTQANRGLVVSNDAGLHNAIIAAIAKELPLEDKD
jgi:3'(2'),5'-bisphosphate nucleotidase